MKDLTDQVFGLWTVVDRSSEVTKCRGRPKWNCVCECGTRRSVAAHELTRGKSKSCGCVQRRKNSERMKLQGFKHGYSQTPEYNAWEAMIDRCYNDKNRRFKRYGGRGISVCERWKVSFENFLEDMGPRPSDDHSLDRKNNDGDYDPSNCRWGTELEQRRNRSITIFLEHDGRNLPLGEWSDLTRIPWKILYCRLRAGWSSRDTLMIPYPAHAWVRREICRDRKDASS